MREDGRIKMLSILQGTKSLRYALIQGNQGSLRNPPSLRSLRGRLT